VLAPVPAALPPRPTPAAEPEPPAPEPEPIAPAPAPRTRRRRTWLPIAVAAALLVVLGVLAWVLLSGDEGTAPTIDRPDASESAGGGGGRGGGASDDTSPPAPEGPTAKGIEGFISDYLATAPSSPESGFQMLTPGFQRASGGLSGYTGFWSTIASAEPVDIQPDPDNLTVQYTVDYTREDGSTASDTVVLQLQYTDGQYLIAAEA
jgi:hypothetical protein